MLHEKLFEILHVIYSQLVRMTLVEKVLTMEVLKATHMMTIMRMNIPMVTDKKNINSQALVGCLMKVKNKYKNLISESAASILFVTIQLYSQTCK